MASAGKILWWLIGIAVLVLAGILVWRWVDDNGAADVTDNTNTQQEETVEGEESQLELITENPENYIGQTVTVEGEVQDSISNRVFSIADDPVDEEVLVVTRNALTDEQVADIEPLFQDNPNVEVTGEFRLFAVSDIETEFDIDFDQEVEAEFEDQYVIIADNVTFTDSGQDFDFFNGDDEEQTTE